ncbi:unnamed protein product, partial [marine sediment metagenome]
MKRSIILNVLLLLIMQCGSNIVKTPTPTAQKILTACEKSDFERYCTHEEMMEFLSDINAGSQEMRLSTFGKSVEGRELVYSVFSRPM